MGERPLLQPDSWIEKAIDDIDHDVDNNQHYRYQQHCTHNQWEIIVLQGINNNHSDAFPIEYILNKHSSCH